MKAKIAILVLLLTAATCLAAGFRVVKRPPQSGDVSTLVGANNDLGLRLFEQVRSEDPSKNVFISPASIILALAMLYNGADGATKTQMEQVLALQGIDVDSLNAAAGKLVTWLKSADPEVELAIANSVWAKEDFPFKESFIQLAQDAYDADAFPLTTADKINAWVSQKTRDKIPQIVDQIEPDAVMFLINAIYFKGAWSVPFAESKTRERDFTLFSGQKIKHPLMDNSDEYPYWEDSTVQAVKLPYGDGLFSMVVLLPRDDYRLTKLLDDLTVQYWREKQSRFHERKGRIVLPRFTNEYEVTLNEALKSLGMRDAFERWQADFSKLWWKPAESRPLELDSNVYVKKVRHKTFVQVNEEGTEAAAATSVEMGLVTDAYHEPQPPFEMIVDRPFVCAIVDDRTGLILFLGVICDPRGEV